ncbi:MAG TPA: type II toxin-antitoxin system VapC family toxin [Candidatus Sulfotelmatobacter sp.]|nr:type II toxin-antitoxin system VapC family toxin [Candidatus Sulfotelmatobacter sp.]
MNVLLDTHTLLWALTDEAKLSHRVRDLLPKADTWFSVAGLWEILIKVQIGKIRLPQPAGPFLMSKLAFNGVRVLPVTADHALRVESLPNHHNDPFDRMLIAQSLEENLPVVTVDRAFSHYQVEVIW